MMRQRLIVALVGVALVSVLLVGAGVLFLAQLGARDQAAADVEERLEALADLLDAGTSPVRGLNRAERALNLSQLALVGVTDDGAVLELGSLGRNGSINLGGSQVLQLDDTELAAFLAGRAVLIDGTDDESEVRALRILDRSMTAMVDPDDLDGHLGTGPDDDLDHDPSDDPDDDLDDLGGVGPRITLGLMASQPVVAIASEARTWFAVSAAVVLISSLALAAVLSRRLVRPIDRIQRATAAIAEGDLGARVEIEGHDELAELGRSVNVMAAELERAKAADQQFLLSVSHDLRTPLTAISGYAEALRDDAVGDPARAGTVIGDHADRLDRLVGDLLDLAKLEARRFTLHVERSDAAVVVGRAVAGRMPVADRHGIDLRFEPGPPALADIDPDRLTQMVDNVIDNAITFASSRIEVEVATPAPRPAGPSDDDTGSSASGTTSDATAGPADDDRIRIKITDDGPGIPADDLPHIFERLYVSAAQPARSENPSGLGLAIVRELAAAMGGSVAAISEPGAGTTIEIALPPAARASNRRPSPLDQTDQPG
jgi:signal transduction histidine kinase